MSGPQISDHALLRFLERGGDIDVEALRTAPSASLARAHRAARAIGQEDYLVKAGSQSFVVRGDIVTTVFDTASPGSQARALEKRQR